jgi:CRISPR/Cas system-associated protein endoribonuclease Cas2
LEAASMTAESVHTFMPNNGAVRVMTVTERQYHNMFVFLGERHHQESFLDNDGNLFFD